MTMMELLRAMAADLWPLLAAAAAAALAVAVAGLRGLPPGKARFAARASFGGVAAMSAGLAAVIWPEYAAAWGLAAVAALAATGFGMWLAGLAAAFLPGGKPVPAEPGVPAHAAGPWGWDGWRRAATSAGEGPLARLGRQAAAGLGLVAAGMALGGPPAVMPVAVFCGVTWAAIPWAAAAARRAWCGWRGHRTGGWDVAARAGSWRKGAAHVPGDRAASALPVCRVCRAGLAAGPVDLREAVFDFDARPGQAAPARKGGEAR
jgi:hypothetical protein